jgi:multidrug efflux pump subunit AcrA (membrane-fusion protein)
MPKQGETPMNSNDTNSIAVDTTKIPDTSPAEVPETKPPLGKFSRSGLIVLGATALVVAIVIVFGVHSRVAAETRLQQATFQAAISSVNVVHPQPGDRAQELVLPGNTQAFIDSPIYARTNGYLKVWYVDIGARVSKGQLLAEIETPELDQQLRQAARRVGYSRSEP